ncbi:hypothetical protein CDO52_12755 [Nocardiopsis gilva YIM 90087]|uniref:Uncharacterized protein n=1 Tax=Nocardiopsis gilva YIM 90087 TaxID=1235441 RepID=A0A223S607_9ACTN|nr:hypothetical protein [Nocardiopsis gilva]ASU83541.1 hypothetical protein CDO52_12755 [Nocardiopsis gilva YIM 90087]
MIARLASLFRRSRPEGGPVAPAPPLVPDPDGDTAISHMHHAHRLVAVARLLHGRALVGHTCLDLNRVDDAAVEAIERLKTFRARLADERSLLAQAADADPDDLTGGA